MDLEYYIFELTFNFSQTVDRNKQPFAVSTFLGNLRSKLISGKYTFDNKGKLIEVDYDESITHQCDNINFINIGKTIKNG